MLKPGPVTSVFTENANSRGNLEELPVELKLGNKAYLLKVVGPAKDAGRCNDSAFPRNARLVLVSGKSAQTLYTLDDANSISTSTSLNTTTFLIEDSCSLHALGKAGW